VLSGLGEGDEIVIIDLNLRLSYPYVSQRGGSGHGDTLLLGSTNPVGRGATYLPW
jgi:hypothetical protein